MDKSDAAFFISLFTLSLVAGIVVLSAFTAIAANAIAMIVLGKLMAILDASIFYFFHYKKAASGEVIAEDESEIVADEPKKRAAPYDLNPLK